MKYNDIVEAKEILNLPDRASMKEIKANYRKLLHQYHPDKCKSNKEKCIEITIKVNAAYKAILIYCDQYKYSFTEEEVKKYLSDEDWWTERFGDDPLWGKP